MSQTALYSQVIRLAGDSGQPQGSAASAIVREGLKREPSSQLQPKVSCKFLFENRPSGFSPLLEDGALSWDRVNTINGEDNRGQGID